MILVKNGRVFSSGRFVRKDIYIKDGLFSKKGEADEVYDAEGNWQKSFQMINKVCLQLQEFFINIMKAL